MKPNLFTLPIIAGALVILSGCQSGSPDSSKPSSSGAAVSTPTPAVSTPAPAVSTPTPVVAAPPTQAAAPGAAIRINAGGSALKDSAGVSWLGDTGFTGGDVVERPDIPIANTKTPEIYRSEHYSMESFSQAVPNGKYQVKLHFCETFEGITGPGERVFSFDVEGKPFKDFDVWVKSGGAARAYVETVPVDVTDGKVDIKFTSNVENPQINAIEIIPAP